MAQKTRNAARVRRHRSIRLRISGTVEKPRLCVFRSLSEIYGQIIDDVDGRTIISASSIDKELREQVKGMNKTDQARMVGETLGKRAIEVGVNRVVFDRGGYQYIGRVKALAEGARKAGLQF